MAVLNKITSCCLVQLPGQGPSGKVERTPVPRPLGDPPREFLENDDQIDWFYHVRLRFGTPKNWVYGFQNSRPMRFGKTKKLHNFLMWFLDVLGVCFIGEP